MTLIDQIRKHRREILIGAVVAPALFPILNGFHFLFSVLATLLGGGA